MTEIDGSQHYTEANIERDRKRDTIIKSYGWKIIRIPWRSVRTEQGKAEMIGAADSIVKIIPLFGSKLDRLSHKQETTESYGQEGPKNNLPAIKRVYRAPVVRTTRQALRECGSQSEPE